MIATVRTELVQVPRADRGSAQNLYRAVFWAARMNSLGRSPQIPPTREAAQELAIAVVRSSRAEFAQFAPRFV
jgi:hypothetical protein